MSTDNVRKGVRRTMTMGNRSLRHCKSCQRRFTVQRAARPDAHAQQRLPS